jgi:hypothetical protein
MSAIPNILEGAKKALTNAGNFTQSVTGGKPSAFTPKSEVKSPTDYSHARAARKDNSLMGQQGGEEAGKEMKSAFDARKTNFEEAKKSLEQ